MENPYRTFLAASRLARKGRPLAALLKLQQAALASAKPQPKPKPKRKRRRTPAKPKRTLPVADRARRREAMVRHERPAPGTFTHGRYDGGHGEMAYRLYTPVGAANRRLPLVVMLHGCTQSAADFAAGTGMNRLADEVGFLVLYPEQSLSANYHRCWNWHQPGNQRRGTGEPAAIAALTLHAIAACRANRRRVYIAGISAGGTAAALTGAAYPEIFAAIGLHSAVATGGVRTLAGALSAMRKGDGSTLPVSVSRSRPTIIFHGDGDSVVHPDNASGLSAGLRRSRKRPLTSLTRTGRSAGGRAYTRTLYRAATGHVILENWTVHGGGHAWFGGDPAGTHTDPEGPDASRAMIRFFLSHRLVGDGG